MKEDSRINRRDALKIGGLAAGSLILGCHSSVASGDASSDQCLDLGAVNDRQLLQDQVADLWSPPFVLMQLSDVHIGAQDFSLNAFKLAINDIFPVIQPQLMSLTGDLVDKGETLSQWQSYRSVLDQAGLDFSTLYEQAGNHDAKGDDQLENFLSYTPTGQARSRLFGFRDIEYHGKIIRIISINTASAGVYDESFPNTKNLTGYFHRDQKNELMTLIHAESILPDLSLIMGHHPMKTANGLELFNTDHYLEELIEETKAMAYFFGHVHREKLDHFNDCLMIQAPTLGNPALLSTKPGFTLFSFDRVIATKFIKLEKSDENATINWPIVFITYPMNADLPIDVSTLPKNMEGQILRAKVYAPTSLSGAVEYRINEEAWKKMEDRNGHFEAYFSTPDADRCTIEVRALYQGMTGTDKISVELS